MTILTARVKNLVDQEIPYECCACPFSSLEGFGKYRCALTGKSGSQINDNPACLGSKVVVKKLANRTGEIAVVRVDGDMVLFKVAMDDGKLANVSCEECELA